MQLTYFGILPALLLSQAAQDGRLWSYFDSRETERGPTLELVLTDGSRRSLAADADSILLQYLPEEPYPYHPQLSVDLGDRCRVLIRWPLEPGLAIESAWVRLHSHPSESWPPQEPFDVAVHALREAWTEADACWAGQPEFDPAPLARIPLQPEGGLWSCDITALAASWAAGTRPNDGLLLRAAEPIPVPAEPVQVAAQPTSASAIPLLEAELDGLFPWKDTLAEALAEAKLADRDVLVVVTASFGREVLSEQERLLLATVLSHPQVRAAIRARFVPVRVRVSPAVVALAFEQADVGAEHLAAIGLELPDAKPPTLLRVGADGRVRGRLGAFAVCDQRTVLALLGEAPSAGTEAWKEIEEHYRSGRFDRAQARLAELEGDPEALYWLADLAFRRGDSPASAGLLARLEREHPESPWVLKARSRRAWPELVAGYEALVSPSESRAGEALAARATRQLLDLQLPDGSFPMGHPPFEVTREGITALASFALLVEGHAEASARGREWLAARLSTRPPEEVNSFTATYWLDLALERAARGGPRAEVDGAVALLLAGQLEGGAWSYDRRFGTTWRGGFGGWPETDRGRTHSMNTGIALEALTRAQSAGFEVPDDALERGRNALLAMRAGPGAYTYTWPDPVIYATVNASIARAPAAELALYRLGAIPLEDLQLALREFDERRHTLAAPAQLSDSWLPPHALSGYFHSFAYYHAARAAREAGGREAAGRLGRMQADVLARVESDGTWLDTISLGKAYATAMALLVLKLTEP